MKVFLTWIYTHPHEFIRIVFLIIVAAIFSPWRVEILSVLLCFDLTLLYLVRNWKE